MFFLQIHVRGPHIYKFHDDASISSTVSNNFIGFPIFFRILVKIDDVLMLHFVLDALHSGAGLPNVYILLISASTCC